MSSTPTGRRSKFYDACINKGMGYTEHYHPTMHNPNWGPEMEAEFRSQLSEQGYIHEILAEFGTQDTGVFDKKKLDAAMQLQQYAYNKLDYYQEDKCVRLGINPIMHIYDKNNRPLMQPFRTVGVDFDKYGASSSIIVLDYDVVTEKFKVIKRVELARAEYSYDNALNAIVEINDIYNPSWIYCDRGAGEYIIERLHIIGDERPSTGLKNKVKGWQFSQKLDITNPVSGELSKEPFKPFMVSQLQIAFEREKMILSPFDELLHKQLIDYEVVRQGASGPVFSSENDHFVDALGLAYLAFVLEFKELTNTIKAPEFTNKINITGKQLGRQGLNKTFNSIQTEFSSEINKVLNYDPSELPGDRPTWVKVSSNYKSNSSSGSWGSRSAGTRKSGRGSSVRSTW